MRQWHRYGRLETVRLLPSRIEVLSDEMTAVLRRKTGAERLEIASRMFVSAREMLVNHLRAAHPHWGLKIDVIIPESSDFNRSRFNRVKRVQPGPDWDAAFASPEDAIIKKMEYFREGGSEKHLRDIAGVLKTSGSEIDLDYIEH